MEIDGKRADWRSRLEPMFGTTLRRFFGRRVRDPEMAQDLTQEAFLRILRSSNPPEIQNPQAYIYTVATNLIRERTRRSITQLRPSFSADLNETSQDFDCTELITPERILLGKDTLAHILRRLEALGERTRTIFILHRIDGMGQREIASKLGISVSAVEKHVARALSHLVDCIE